MNNSLSKVHPKPEIKFANLKCVGSQIGRGGVFENSNGISKPHVTTRCKKHESFGKRIYEMSNPNAL